MTSNNFNFIAPFYDFLKKLIFGNKLDATSHHFISEIPAKATVLILGGGTGKLLEQLDELALSIHYLEKSSRMIEMAKKRKLKKSKVKFINADILEYSLSDYQVIITPFALDVFDQQHLNWVIDKLYAALQKEGLWIYTDFQISSQMGFWKQVLLRFMLLFFRITAKLQATELYDAEKLILTKKGMVLIDRKESIDGLVKTCQIKKEAN